MVVNQPYGNPLPAGTGYQFSGVSPQNQPKISNALTDEEIQKLVQKENVFSLAITETEKLRSICTHRLPDGNDACQDIGGGMQRCSICGHEFMPIDVNTSLDSIREDVARVVDTLQTTKLLYIDMPQSVAREYYQVIALLGKIPELFEHACKDYARHERFIPGSYNNRTMNVLSLYNMITGGMAAPVTDQYGNPINPGFSQDGMWSMGNPAFNPQNYAPYGFGAAQWAGPAQGSPNPYQPTNTNYQYDPNAQQYGAAMNPPQGQPAPVANGEAAPAAQPEGVTEVKTTFKA